MVMKVMSAPNNNRPAADKIYSVVYQGQFSENIHNPHLVPYIL